MKYTCEKPLTQFEFWAGAEGTVADLTYQELEMLDEMLEDFGMEWTETDINDFFWFERDTIAEMLGYNDYEEIMARNKD